MSARNSSRWLLVLFAGVMSLIGSPTTTAAEQLLVADRVSNNVYRYSATGAFLGVVLADNTLLDEPAGIAVSPDYSKLYVSSSGNNSLIQYDYDAVNGTASNGTVFADSSDGLLFPNAIKFSQDGSKIYVSNLGGTGVAQFLPSGIPAGPPVNGLVGGGAFFQFSGLAYAPGGELLVGAFQDFPGGTVGAVAKSDPSVTTLGDFVAPNASINGAAGLLASGNDLYVSGLLGTPQGNGALRRFDATTGAIDAGFGVDGLAFPRDIIAAPDNNGMLVGILGYTDGTGNISRYDYEGNFLSIFASPGPGTFTEATALTTVPEPSSVALVVVACGALGLATRRRWKR
jgi:DNA-binding beta-propeller fold protein YncE